MELLSNEVTPHPDYLDEGPLSPMSAHYQNSLKGYLSPIGDVFAAIALLFTGRNAEASV